MTFDRMNSDARRRRAIEEIAAQLDLDSAQDLQRVLNETVSKARDGHLSDQETEKLAKAIDLVQRVEALDKPWVFGQRYMRHKFVSSDPMCHACRNSVPHRTVLICPTCGSPGPWLQEERTIPPSYIHYFLVEQATRLLESRLILPSKTHYADGMVTAVPRGGAKSTWLCEIMALWMLLTERSRCLLLLSNTTNQATERSREIRTELEENEAIIADFGEMKATKQESRPWAVDEFVLPNGGRLVAKGAMQSLRGVKNRQWRPDCVIADDSDDDKNLTSADMAGKVWDWWDTRVVPSCTPNAVFMFHGTVIGELGLLWQMMNGHRGATMATRTFRALRDAPGCKTCGMPAPKTGAFDCPVCNTRTEAESPSSYWGARFTVPALATTRNRVGHWSWQTEYMQEPHDSTTSWFNKRWLDAAKDESLAPLTKGARRLIPWSIISVSLSASEMLRLAALASPDLAAVPGDRGPYQLILQSWDPAWAREKGPKQKTAYMAGIGIGLTWDDKFDVFWIDRDKGLPGDQAYRDWMYRTWIDSILPNGSESRSQIGMIIEENAAGVLFQYGVEDHWGSVPVISHTTGAEKHDLIDGIPGLASSFEQGRVIIRAGGSDKQRNLANELITELQHSGLGQYKDLMMALWFAWAYMQRWMRDIRDPARYDELARRNALASGTLKHR